MTEQIIKRLQANDETITFAESCTGGRIASEFTSIPGASAVLNGSFVTYSNQIKHLWLDVDQKILQEFGAVSGKCVELMSQGALRKADATYAISVSGIAGPTGGTSQKPVGTVFINISSRHKISTSKHLFRGNRAQIQEMATGTAIALFWEFLENIQKSLDN